MRHGRASRGQPAAAEGRDSRASRGIVNWPAGQGNRDSRIGNRELAGGRGNRESRIVNRDPRRTQSAIDNRQSPRPPVASRWTASGEG
jgi:hypothetical protein